MTVTPCLPRPQIPVPREPGQTIAERVWSSMRLWLTLLSCPVLELRNSDVGRGLERPVWGPGEVQFGAAVTARAAGLPVALSHTVAGMVGHERGRGSRVAMTLVSSQDRSAGTKQESPPQR